MTLRPLPDSFATTRDTLQRVATHVLARRRHQLCGKIGLRAAPGGIGTPACGPDHEVLRISGTQLVRERTGTGTGAQTTSVDLATATLDDAAAFADVDLTAPFEAGHDTPAVGNSREPLRVDASAAGVLADWFQFGWTVLDTTVAALGSDAQPSVVQLWPEHFDAGFDVAATPDRRVNLGASPGDSFSAQPYLYVGPWDAERPGDPDYWNAPFGAVLTYDQLAASPDPAGAAVAFLRRGVELLQTSTVSAGA
ncbi:MAG: hypothetical protein AB7H92_16855 [Microbacteriaceae bacterium]